MKRIRGRKMSWDPRSILYLSQLPLQVKGYMRGQQLYEYLGESKCYSCPNLVDELEGDGNFKIS